jgi:hypothetical protein
MKLYSSIKNTKDFKSFKIKLINKNYLITIIINKYRIDKYRANK